MNKSVVFFPTNNIGKFDRYRIAITGRGIEYNRYLQLQKGGDCRLDVPEDKATPRENAEAKARAYYEEYRKHISGNFAIITTDESLYFDDLDDDQQPGMYVRRFNGIKGRASDAEVVARYTDFVKSLGGTAKAKWVYSLVMFNGTDFSYMEWVEPVIFGDTPHLPITPGYVLNNITIVRQDKNGKPVMLSDLSESEREEYLSQYTKLVADHIDEHIRSRESTDGPHNCQSDEISR